MKDMITEDRACVNIDEDAIDEEDPILSASGVRTRRIRKRLLIDEFGASCISTRNEFFSHIESQFWFRSTNTAIGCQFVLCPDLCKWDYRFKFCHVLLSLKIKSNYGHPVP